MDFVRVFSGEGKNRLLDAIKSRGIPVPDEYAGKKMKWGELYVVDRENRTVKLITDDHEIEALIHTGVCVLGVDEFIEEIDSGILYERIWKKLYSEDGTLAYEGFTEAGKPHGAGKAFYPNGTTYQEGIFGMKGLLSGVEYYDNGQIRFDGVWGYHQGYGPNYPVYGRCFYRDGKLMYEGKLKIRFVGNYSYPTVEEPKGFGPVAMADRPRF